MADAETIYFVAYAPYLPLADFRTVGVASRWRTRLTRDVKPGSAQADLGLVLKQNGSTYGPQIRVRVL